MLIMLTHVLAIFTAFLLVNVIRLEKLILNIKKFVIGSLSTHAHWIGKFDQRLSRSMVLHLVEPLHVGHDIPCLGIVYRLRKLSLRSYVRSLLLLVHHLLLLIMLSLIVISLLLLLLLLLLILLLLLLL